MINFFFFFMENQSPMEEIEGRCYTFSHFKEIFLPLHQRKGKISAFFLGGEITKSLQQNRAYIYIEIGYWL